MEAVLLMSDAASQHPDGTFSVLRAGIDRVVGPKTPITFRGALVVRLKAELGDAGDHEFDVKCMDADGGQQIPPIQGKFEVPKGGGASVLVINMGFKFKSYGTYAFVFRVDNVIKGQWPLLVEQLPSSPSQT